MSAARLSVFLFAAAVFFAGCSQTPTSPSRSSASAAAGTGASIPGELTFAPPRAVGITRFVAFGDSITWGATSAFFSTGLFYAEANGGYPERLAANLATFHAPQQFSVFNDGLPGEFAINALTRFRTMLTTRQPGAVLLLEGINDLSSNVPVPQTLNGLRAMLDAAALRGVPVLLATMFPTYAVVDPTGIYRHNGSADVPAFNAGIRALVQGRPNVFLVDLEPAMPNRALVGTDGIHLNDAGFDVVAARFMAVIEQAFPVRGSFQ
jgi:lysophospholipase L1-like esterase